MEAVSDNQILNKIEKNKERGIKLGMFNPGEKPDTESILDIDLIWHLLDISHKIEHANLSFEERHKLMLQYANLNKIRAVNRQTRSKADDRKLVESGFEKVIVEYMKRDKAAAQDLEKKKESIVKKVLAAKELNEEEQDILDVAAKMV